MTKDLEGHKCYNADDQVTVKIQAPSGNFLRKKIEDSVDGTYTVSFTPDTVGLHRVLITVNGQPLTGSPWSVQVSPYQYKHVLTFGSRDSRVGHVFSIDENTDRIAVTDYRRVQIFSADCSYQIVADHKGRTDESPLSVAFTKNGGLIVLSSCGNIYLYSESVQFIKKITNEHLITVCYLSVAPDGNIIVYDKSDENLKVFSPDGAELLQSFSADPPADIVYHQEMFFATRFSEHCVKVYNREGVFLYDIGSEGSGDGQLRFPTGLAIDKFKNLIVCDSENSRLQVFTLDGHFVNTIGKILTDHDLTCPWAVAVSKTGRVYVTDKATKCVHMFE